MNPPAMRLLLLPRPVSRAVPRANGIAVSVGLALAHNTIDKDVNASIVNVSSVLTNEGDITVRVDDDSEIEVYSFAVAVAVAVSGNISVAVAGGAAESTNIILTRSNAWISNSNLGTALEKVGKIDLDVDNSAKIDAVVGTIAASVALGKSAVGVAIGISVARNFIGWGIDDSVTGDYQTGTGLAQGRTLAQNQKVKVTEGARDGDVYKYLGNNQTQPTATGNSTQTKSLSRNNDYVLISDTYTGSTATVGAIYKYVGNNRSNVVLANEDYTDADNWELASIDLRTPGLLGSAALGAGESRFLTSGSRSLD